MIYVVNSITLGKQVDKDVITSLLMKSSHVTKLNVSSPNHFSFTREVPHQLLKMATNFFDINTLRFYLSGWVTKICNIQSNS